MQSGGERLQAREQPGLDDESNRRRGGGPRQGESEDGYEGDHGIQAGANGMPDRDGSHV